MPYDPFYGVPQTFEEYMEAQEPKALERPRCAHGLMRRKIARQGFDYMGLYVCPRDEARCGVVNVPNRDVYHQWASAGPDKETGVVEL